MTHIIRFFYVIHQRVSVNSLHISRALSALKTLAASLSLKFCTSKKPPSNLCILNKEYQISMAHAQFMSSNLFLYILKDVRIKISSFFCLFLFLDSPQSFPQSRPIVCAQKLLFEFERSLIYVHGGVFYTSIE